VIYTYDAVKTHVRLKSIITSGQIASTEKYALDIENLSLFYFYKFIIQSKMKGGEQFLCNYTYDAVWTLVGP